MPPISLLRKQTKYMKHFSILLWGNEHLTFSNDRFEALRQERWKRGRFSYSPSVVFSLIRWKTVFEQSTLRSFHCWDEELYYNSHSSHRRNKNRFGVLPSLLLQKHIRKFWLKMKRSYCSHFTSSICKIPLKLAGNRKIIFLNLTVRKNILQKCMKKR